MTSLLLMSFLAAPPTGKTWNIKLENKTTKKVEVHKVSSRLEINHGSWFCHFELEAPTKHDAIFDQEAKLTCTTKKDGQLVNQLQIYTESCAWTASKHDIDKTYAMSRTGALVFKLIDGSPEKYTELLVSGECVK